MTLLVCLMLVGSSVCELYTCSYTHVTNFVVGQYVIVACGCSTMYERLFADERVTRSFGLSVVIVSPSSVPMHVECSLFLRLHVETSICVSHYVATRDNEIGLDAVLDVWCKY